ncbi:MAG: phosphopantothenate/pantothenate synthetase [Thermoplasmata archaeon]|nr:phosphopantothenate/pantothenate synthetase [Thermoplasmata archaeon]MCI4359121.1 phosphopantothenate/pantothenate synthetase [Thermoplasmata archaeon]
MTRARLGAASRSHLVVPEGLIAHGRGEAFDYFLGERSTRSARTAERIAAQWLAVARHPVLSVNGNVAALAAAEIRALQRARPGLVVEVNLFHRTPARVRSVVRVLQRAGVVGVLGERATGRIPHLPSDRARAERDGILRADLCVVPLEDGDRALAMRRMGKRVISIDLNPLSRTSQVANLPIVDELTRALRAITRGLRSRRRRPFTGRFDPVDRRALLAVARREMASRLTRGLRRDRRPSSVRRYVPRPAREIARPTRRTP